MRSIGYWASQKISMNTRRHDAREARQPHDLVRQHAIDRFGATAVRRAHRR